MALAFLAIVLAMAAVPMVSAESVTRSTVAASLAAASVDASLQAATATVRPWREIVAPATLRALQSVASLPKTLARRRDRLRGATSRPYVNWRITRLRAADDHRTTPFR